MRTKQRPLKQKSLKGAKRGRPRKVVQAVEQIHVDEIQEDFSPPPKKARRGRPARSPNVKKEDHDEPEIITGSPNPLQMEGDEQMVVVTADDAAGTSAISEYPDDLYSEGLHMSTMQVRALSQLIGCKDCGEEVTLGVRPTTKGMISEFTVTCKICGSSKSTNTPNLIRERKRKREKKGVILQKNENINYAHVAAYLDNGLGYSGLRHYCKYFNARCLNEATFIVYAKQVIADAVTETEEFLQQNARIVRKAFETQMESDYIIDLTVSYTTTYHQWGSDFCLVAGAVIELQTGLVLDYDVGNMYCHVCKINAKKIVSMTPVEMTEWFNKHQDTCEIREWCDEIDQDSDEGLREIDPKYLEAFIAKKIWNRSMEKFGFRYTTMIHESDEKIHSELLKATPYGDIPVLIDSMTSCFTRRKSEHARTSFQNKLKSKCPRERVQTKDRIMYVYSTSIPEYNKFAIGSNIKLRELVRQMEIEEEEYAEEIQMQVQGDEEEEEEVSALMEETPEMKTERQRIVEQVEGTSELEALQQELNEVMAEEQAIAAQEKAALENNFYDDEEQDVEEISEEQDVEEISEEHQASTSQIEETKTVETVSQEQRTITILASQEVEEESTIIEKPSANKLPTRVELEPSSPVSNGESSLPTVVNVSSTTVGNKETPVATVEKKVTPNEVNNKPTTSTSNNISSKSPEPKTILVVNSDGKEIDLGNVVFASNSVSKVVSPPKENGTDTKKIEERKEVSSKPFRVELDED